MDGDVLTDRLINFLDNFVAEHNQGVLVDIVSERIEARTRVSPS